MSQPPAYYHIGIDAAAKCGDHCAVTVICSRCHTVIHSTTFEGESVLTIPHDCPNCSGMKSIPEKPEPAKNWEEVEQRVRQSDSKCGHVFRPYARSATHDRQTSPAN